MGDPVLAVHSLTGIEMDVYVESVDREFMEGRGRTGSLRNRFPCVFGEHAQSRVLGIRSGDELLAAAAIRDFAWESAGQTWLGAMIGMVWTNPGHRGRGLGLSLMEGINQDLRARSLDFGLLWTTIPGFYEKAKWSSHSLGYFSGPLVTGRCGERGEVAFLPCGSPLASEIERVREEYRRDRVLRKPADYDTLPLGVDSVICCMIRAEGCLAYAIVGEWGGSGFLYEMEGAPILFPRLWSAISSAFDTVSINEVPGTTSFLWTSSLPGLSWHVQRHAMWLKGPDDCRSPEFDAWSIPYFDRI